MNIMGKKNMPSINTRGISIRTKILAFTITMIVVSNLILGLGTFAYSKNLIFEQVQNKAMNIANDAARFTDGDELERIEEISPDNETVVKYSNTYLKLSSEIGASYIYVFMLDDKGEPFFGATSDIAESSDSIGEGFEMYPGMQKAFDGEVAADDEATTDEWGTFLSGYSPVFNSAGQVVGIVGADIEYSELLKKLDNLRLRIFAMYMVIATILVIGCLIISKLLKNGFYILNSKVEELADGSGDLNREVEIKSGDEFETVAESINHFIGEVRALAETVARETDESAETVNRINESVTELSANIEECSATSETISDRLEDTANNVKQMAAMVRNIDDKVMEASGKALKESESALAHKEEATISIQKIQNDVRNATERAKAVDRVQVTAAEIQRIAAETRILALNAQLEAARAGSYGRGFAVVASEMEALNEQIANAVAEITEVNETVIESVNELIGGTVKIDKYLTENVLPDYDDYAKLGREYGEMANFISKDMSVLTSHTDKVADEVETINIGVRDISRAVADSANQVTMVSSVSHSIVENMDRLTDNSMLKMVKT